MGSGPIPVGIQAGGLLMTQRDTVVTDARLLRRLKKILGDEE